MILENSKGKERNFKILFELHKNDSNYIVYQDITSTNIYAGKEKNNKLLVVNDEELDFLNNILDKMME